MTPPTRRNVATTCGHVPCLSHPVVAPVDMLCFRWRVSGSCGSLLQNHAALGLRVIRVLRLGGDEHHAVLAGFDVGRGILHGFGSVGRDLTLVAHQRLVSGPWLLGMARDLGEVAELVAD